MALAQNLEDPKFEVVRIGHSYYRLGETFELLEFCFFVTKSIGSDWRFHWTSIFNHGVKKKVKSIDFQVGMGCSCNKTFLSRKLVVDENLKFKCEEFCRRCFSPFLPVSLAVRKWMKMAHGNSLASVTFSRKQRGGNLCETWATFLLLLVCPK